MRIVFAGTPETAVPSLRSLYASQHDVVGVLTREDAPLGRKRVMTPSAVAEAAAELGIPIFKANRLGADAAEWISALDADLGVIVAYGVLLKQPILSRPRHGWINLHFSDLPRYRGAAPVQRALMAGEQTLGLTVFRLTEALDAGDVLSRDELSVEPGTTSGLALERLAEHGTAALQEAIELLKVRPDAGEPQFGESSYAHKLNREDGHLPFTISADEALAWWAGVTPEPGAWANCDGAAVKLHEMRTITGRPETGIAAGKAGRLSLAGDQAILQFAEGALEVVRLQPAGKTIMDAVSWLRGRGGEALLE